MTITETGRAFFESCESGQGWHACSGYCAAGATFTAQAAVLANVTTVREYSGWMRGLLTVLPDALCELKSLTTDAEHGVVCAHGVLTGTHRVGGPCLPTGKRTTTDWALLMTFTHGEIVHITKIWHADFALRQLGWIRPERMLEPGAAWRLVA